MTTPWERYVEYEIEVLPEDAPVRGNAIVSGDADFDRQVEDDIIERLEVGDIWAWCTVRVIARLGVLEGDAYLGCCSYADKDDFRASGYFDDLRIEALDRLRIEVEYHDRLIHGRAG